MSEPRWTLAELAQHLDVELHGDPNAVITGLATIGNAQSGDLTFLANPLYRNQLAACAAGAVILQADCLPDCPGNALVAANPYLAYSKVSHLFDRRHKASVGVHPTAYVADDVVMGEGCRIGPNAVVEAGSVLGNDVEVGAGAVIGANCTIGNQCLLHANVTFYHEVRVGDRCTFQSGVVVGGDGFGFANEQGQWRKIAQIGGVRIGNDVEVGANTTIDRGAIQDTVIANGVILDNQIQIAHNVEIGEGTAIAGCTGIAGSTKIGKYCTIAGDVGIAGHLTIADKVHLSMRTSVTKSISQPGSYSSGTVLSPTAEWRKNAARFRKLDEMARRLFSLEKRLSSQKRGEND